MRASEIAYLRLRGFSLHLDDRFTIKTIKRLKTQIRASEGCVTVFAKKMNVSKNLIKVEH